MTDRVRSVSPRLSPPLTTGGQGGLIGNGFFANLAAGT
jgi:hypothetical protein